MAILPIVKTPNPILRAVAKPVGQIDKKVLRLIADLVSTLRAQKEPPGVGLAAPQVGISLRIFVMQPTTKSAMTVVINPEETGANSGEVAAANQGKGTKSKQPRFLEGCLSLPSFYSDIKRAPSITLKFTTLESGVGAEPKVVTKTFHGFAAQVVQHELDHLNGRLFVDHVLEQKQKLLRLKGNNWEEVGLGVV